LTDRVNEMWYIADIPVVEANHGAVVTLFLFTVLAAVIVCLRLFVRIALLRYVGADDYWIIAAFVRIFLPFGELEHSC
jgi:hypothetical protein